MDERPRIRYRSTAQSLWRDDLSRRRSPATDGKRVAADDVRQSVTAERAVDGAASYEITGSSRQNEAGVVEIYAILADRLRADGLLVGEARRRRIEFNKELLPRPIL